MSIDDDISHLQFVQRYGPVIPLLLILGLMALALGVILRKLRKPRLEDPPVVWPVGQRPCSRVDLHNFRRIEGRCRWCGATWEEADRVQLRDLQGRFHD